MDESHAAFEWERIDRHGKRWLKQDALHAGLLARGWDQDEVAGLFDELVGEGGSEAVVTKDQFVEVVSWGGGDLRGQHKRLGPSSSGEDGEGGDGAEEANAGGRPLPLDGKVDDDKDEEEIGEGRAGAAETADYSCGGAQASSTNRYPLDPTRCYFPMYVVSGKAIRALGEIPHHEQALKDGLLIEVDRVEEGKFSNKRIFLKERGRGANGKTKPPREVSDTMVYFFSHRWMRPSLDAALAHPDDEGNTKLKAIKHIVSPSKYFWIDYMCIPQRDPRNQLRAIQSLPYYVHASARFTALVCGAKGKEEYLDRAWCQAELIASKLPLRMPYWEAAWLHGRGMFRDISNESSGEARLDPILVSDIRDPSQCRLTNPADAFKLVPLLLFAAGELEALTEWDASPNRAASKTFGRGATSIDEDKSCKERGLTRASIMGLAKRLRNSSDASKYGQ